MGRLTVEQLAEISAKKKKAREFQAEHVGFGHKIKARAFRDDDQDKIIPEHGRRGRKTVHPQLKQKKLQRSTIFARHLVNEAEEEFFLENRREGVNIRPTEIPLAPLVVVDTSVITMAIGTNQLKACRGIVDLVMDGKIRPCVIDPLVREYQVVIGRSRLPDDVRFDEGSRKLLDEFLARCLVFSGRPETFPDTIKDDPSDDILLIAQAIAQEQEKMPCAIVSRDKHVLGFSKAPELNIMHPAIYLARLAAAFPQSLLSFENS